MENVEKSKKYDKRAYFCAGKVEFTITYFYKNACFFEMSMV